MFSRNPPGSVTFLLVMAVVIAGLFPLFQCPHFVHFDGQHVQTPEGQRWEPTVCAYCGSKMEPGIHEKGRTTLWNWIKGEISYW
jgi:hypothetical protein